VQKIPGLPILGGEKHHECQVVKGDDEWDKSCGKESYQCTVPKCSRNEGTADLNVGTLKANVRGCHWDMQLFTERVITCQCRTYT
jgi:hypothetical protein